MQAAALATSSISAVSVNSTRMWPGLMPRSSSVRRARKGALCIDSPDTLTAMEAAGEPVQAATACCMTAQSSSSDRPTASAKVTKSCVF